MARRILLLTNPEVGEHCRHYLQRCNPDLDICVVYDLDSLYVNLRGHEAETRLISFLTQVIVPADILASLRLTPYNIHPGPPEYPGSHPEAFAIWEHASHFGVTAHEIAVSVDSGPIVYVERFAMPEKPELQELAETVFPAAVRAFAEVAEYCAHSDASLPQLGETWSTRKGTRRAFRELCRAGDAYVDQDYDRLQRACGVDLIETHKQSA